MCFILFSQVFNKRSFTKNYLVQNLVAKLDDLECLGSCPAPSKPVKVDEKCDQHGEELKLYCQTDKRPICVVCRESRAHRSVVIDVVFVEMTSSQTAFLVCKMHRFRGPITF